MFFVYARGFRNFIIFIWFVIFVISLLLANKSVGKRYHLAISILVASFSSFLLTLYGLELWMQVVAFLVISLITYLFANRKRA